jgi:hypothetical protein
MGKVPKKVEPLCWPDFEDDEKSRAKGSRRISDSLRVDLSFGEMYSDDIVTQDGRRFQVKELIDSGLEFRLKRLRRFPPLIPAADAIGKLADARGMVGKKYQGDWEIRAKLAEAELAALYLEANTLPKRARQATALMGAIKRHQNSPKQQMKSEVRVLWEEWREGTRKAKGKNRAADFFREIEAMFPDVEQKTLESWHAKWKKQG